MANRSPLGDRPQVAAEAPDRVVIDVASRLATWGAIGLGDLAFAIGLREPGTPLAECLVMIAYFSLLGAGTFPWYWAAGGPVPEGWACALAPGRVAWLLVGTAAGWAVGAGLGALTGRPHAGILIGLPLALYFGAAAALGRCGAWLAEPGASGMVERGRAAAGSPRLALACYGKAILLDPGCAAAHRERGTLLGQLRLARPPWAFGARATRADFLIAALADLDEAVGLGAATAADYGLRSLLRDELRCYHGSPEDHEAYRALSLADLDEAIRLDSGVAEYHHARGQIRPSGDDDQLADFREAVRLDPGSSRYRYFVGTCLLERGDHGAALEQFDAILAADPRDALGLRGRSQAVAAAGDPGASDDDVA